MVKRYDPTGESFLYGAMKEALDDGDYVLHSDYAALAQSHARLLEALDTVIEMFGPTQAGLVFRKRQAIDKCREAITAAEPFAKK